MKKLLIVFLGIAYTSSLVARHVVAHVFIHGTILPGLGIVSAKDVLKGTLSDHHWYTKTIERARRDGFLQKTDLIYEPGLVHITPLLAQVCTPQAPQQAALHIIHSFAQLQATLPSCPESSEFYTFQWNGLLSETYREKASHELFQALYMLKKQYSASGDTLEYHVYTHSHAAQLVFHLPVIAAQQGISDLYIQRVILSAPPLYQEKARYSLSGMFGTIINVYGPGDMIQDIDRFSTPGRSCVKTFAQLGIESSNTTRIIDVRIRINGRDDAIGHPTFFVLNRYCSNKKDQSVIDLIAPLPLVALYPLLLDPLLSTQVTQTQVTIDITTMPQILLLGLEPSGCVAHIQAQDELLCSIPLLPDVIKSLRQNIDRTYQKQYGSEFLKGLKGIKKLWS